MTAASADPPTQQNSHQELTDLLAASASPQDDQEPGG